jgi:hypothetical protein
MTMRRLASWMFRVGFCASLVILHSAEVYAQSQIDEAVNDTPETTSLTSVLEFAAGYTAVRFAGSDTMIVGWSASFAARPARFFALVSELSGSYGERPRPNDSRHSAIFFLNGPRLRGNIRRVTFFGDALLGIAHDRDFRGSTEDENRFVWRPGGGVDVRLSSSVSVRFAGGSIFNLASGETPRVDQFTTAIVFGNGDPPKTSGPTTTK